MGKGNRLRRLAGMLVASGIWLAVLGVIAVVLAPWVSTWEALPARTRIWLGVIENFYPPFCAGAASLVLLALLLRRRRAALVAACAMLVAGMPVLASLHAAPKVAEDAPRLKVVAFNVWVRNGDTARLVDYLRSARPDIVFLEEVTETHKRALAGLKDLYPTQVTCHTDLVDCETMLLARYPARWKKAGALDGALPSMAAAELDLGGRSVTAVAVHLAQPFPWHGRDAQREQALHLAEVLDAVPGPLIVGGDFNGASWARNPSAVKRLARLRSEPGLHPSWPALAYAGLDVPALLRLPIDHVFTRDGPVVVEAGTGPALGSDHLPLVA